MSRNTEQASWVARILDEIKSETSPEELDEETHAWIVARFASALFDTDPSFNRDRFFEEAGVK